MTEKYKDFRIFAEKVAIKVGKYLLENQKKVKVLSYKKLQDVLTNIDLEAQEMIISTIKSNFPTHGIIAEEEDVYEVKEYTWVIDPLEGTKYYSKGITFYDTAISMFFNDKPVVGVLYTPPENSLYSASLNEGAFFNGESIKVSDQRELKKSMIYATLPHIGLSRKDFKKTYQKLDFLFKNTYRVRYMASVNKAMAWIAHGAFEAFINIPKEELIWDVSSGFALVTAAGGKVTDLSGSPIKNFDVSKGVVVSNGKIHDKLVSLLSS